MNPDRPTHKSYEQFKEILFNKMPDNEKPIDVEIFNWVRSTILEDLPLGTNPDPSKGQILFFTISPPANMKVDCHVITRNKRKSCKVLYSKLSLQNQKIWLHKYFNLVYRAHVDKYIFVHEINESNNLHIHGIIYEQDIRNDYDLRCFRDSINKHWRTLEIIQNPKLFQRFNHIVFVTDLIHVQQYLSKELRQSKYHFGYVTHVDTDNPNIPRMYTRSFFKDQDNSQMVIPQINYDSDDDQA